MRSDWRGLAGKRDDAEAHDVVAGARERGTHLDRAARQAPLEHPQRVLAAVVEQPRERLRRMPRRDQAHFSNPLRQTYASPSSSTATNTIISMRPNQPSGSALDRPRKDEHRLDVEDDEQQRVDVVADVRLAEQRQRIGARFVGDVLLVLRQLRPQDPSHSEHRADHQERGKNEDRDGEILPVELGHARIRCRLRVGRRGVYAWPSSPLRTVSSCGCALSDGMVERHARVSSQGDTGTDRSTQYGDEAAPRRS